MTPSTEIRDLDEMLELVVDEGTFLTFLEALRADFAHESKGGSERPAEQPSDLWWQNRTVDAVLDAAACWGRNSSVPEHPGYRETNPWRRCAHIIYAGKFYE